MNKYLKPLFLFVILFSCSVLIAQTDPPEGVYYQAVARDDLGNEMTNQNLSVQISIRQNDDIIFTENHSPTSDNFGLFELVIGNGELVTENTFSDISWFAGEYFLLVSLDTGGGFEVISETQLLSVPFSLYAHTAVQVINDNVIDADSNPENEAITAFQVVEDSLRISEFGQNFSVAISDIVEDNDWIQQGDTIMFNSPNLNKVGIETESPTSTLSVNGTLSLGVTNPNAPYDPIIEQSINESVILCNVQDGPIEVLLPDATECPGRLYYIKKYADSATDLAQFPVTLTPMTGQTIDLQTSRQIGGLAFAEMTLISDGNNWVILSRSSAN